MSSYTVDGRDTNTANTTILGLTRGDGRVKIYAVISGPSGSAGGNDYTSEAYLQRTTAAGTSTAVTPKKLDPQSTAANASAGEAHSVEPTYTADEIMLTFPGHMRNTVRWEARDEEDMIVIPDTTAAGIGARIDSVSTAWQQVFMFRFKE